MFAWLGRLFEACGLGGTGTSSTSSTPSVTEEGNKGAAYYDIFSPHVSSRRLKYRAPEMRVPIAIAPPTSAADPNLFDILRRVSVVIYNHVKVGEKKVSTAGQAEIFNEKNFRTPIMRYKFVDSPIMAVSGQVFRFEEVPWIYKAPDVEEVLGFLANLFVQLPLSSECSVVCLIYVERLMALARIPLLASNWKPILISACRLASKMWQDLDLWDWEFAVAYPAYTAEKFNKLEWEFAHALDWDLCVPASLYAKYYFALRSLSGRETFRRDFGMILKEDTTTTSEARDGADGMMLSSSV